MLAAVIECQVSKGIGVWGLGFGVWRLGFGVWGLGLLEGPWVAVSRVIRTLDNGITTPLIATHEPQSRGFYTIGFRAYGSWWSASLPYSTSYLRVSGSGWSTYLPYASWPSSVSTSAEGWPQNQKS